MTTRPRTISGIKGLRALVGQDLGRSDWLVVDQGVIDAFADATGDRQWIHVDPRRAADTPFGTTIAHGLLTLSLGPRFTAEIFEIVDIPFILNYGYAKVRFPSPLPVGTRLRMLATLASLEEAGPSATCAITQTFEAEGSDKPVCVAEALFRMTTSA